MCVHVYALYFRYICLINALFLLCYLYFIKKQKTKNHGHTKEYVVFKTDCNLLSSSFCNTILCANHML